jgi:poly(3-hydroxybutyrate) depolymerase
MRVIIALLVLAVAVTAIVPGENKFTITRPEGTRTFYAWVPKSYNISHPSPFPLHLSFHGLGDTCQNFGRATGLRDFTETHNFLFVYPCGSQGLLGTAWNAGTCCLAPSSIDDVGFAKDIVSFMQKNFAVKDENIFASGFSNGGMMAEVISCTAPDVFKATASVSGCVEMEPGNKGGLDACSAAVAKFSQRASTINIHGNFDFTVPWNGDHLLGFPNMPDNFAYWGNRTECTDTPVQTYNKGVYTNQVYQSCMDGAQIELMKVDGGGHHWPRDSDLDTSAYIVAFFERAAAASAAAAAANASHN